MNDFKALNFSQVYGVVESQSTAHNGIRVVGKGSWKEREDGKF